MEQQGSDSGHLSRRWKLLLALEILLSDPALAVTSITWGASNSLNAQAVPQPIKPQSIKLHLWEVEPRYEDLREKESTFYLEM